MLVSLYTESTDTEPAAMQAGFLLNDGNIVDLDGSSSLRFILPGTEYYIKVEHRNHLAVMSAEPVSIINTQ